MVVFDFFCCGFMNFCNFQFEVQCYVGQWVIVVQNNFVFCYVGDGVDDGVFFVVIFGYVFELYVDFKWFWKVIMWFDFDQFLIVVIEGVVWFELQFGFKVLFLVVQCFFDFGECVIIVVV